MSAKKKIPKAKTALRESKPRKSAGKSKPQGKPSGGQGDWRVATLERMRSLILEAEPEIVEDVKWRKPSNNMQGVPVWSHHGIICTGETYKQVVKLTFAKGASLPDPSRLFNSSLEGNTRRAIDIHEGEEVDARALKALIKAAAALNGSPTKKTRSATKETKSSSKAGMKKAKPNALKKSANGIVYLSGGNPQIAKADGDAPVQKYIAAMPGWKSELGKRLDAIIVRAVPNATKAVKWNSPFYGVEGEGWFLSFHVLTRYVKVTFFKGIELKPMPPGFTPRSGESRWIDIYEDDELDETLMAKWIKQAAAIPGWIP